ncbi:hypothetical protein TcasGA2_TC007294 [Tribolium castaneum]|uniref:Uncharacterized protein n=1 Tax=Tribolium castaneum TaxID=7070 RepID=D2A0C8_TRICA|nr:hypothetical protein TcasGA2_TC007294 [Tribolium castaneum]
MAISRVIENQQPSFLCNRFWNTNGRSRCQKASAKGEGDSRGRYTVTATVRHLARRSLGLLFITLKTIAR